MSPPRPISLVMWLHRPEFITEFAATTWAVFQEVAAFYTAADPSASFPMFRSVSSDSESSSRPNKQEVVVSPDLWKATWGRYSGTIDHSKMVQVVREFLPGQDDNPLLLVVDEDLMPPEGFRYLMWSESKRDSSFVLSLSTLDPQYWTEVSPSSQIPSISDDDPKGALARKAITKRRLRAASLLIVGSVLGLKRCEKPDCFLYEQTTSIVSIDLLVQLGPEHAGELPNIGVVLGASFPYESPDPERIDSFVVNPPRGRLYA